MFVNRYKNNELGHIFRGNDRLLDNNVPNERWVATAISVGTEQAVYSSEGPRLTGVGQRVHFCISR